MDLREVGCDDRDWINIAQDRNRCTNRNPSHCAMAGLCEGGNEPAGSLKAILSIANILESAQEVVCQRQGCEFQQQEQHVSSWAWKRRRGSKVVQS
ncbi:hypothetical protein ANN_05350 [Periplaneta americana]|uniref:Uncharacterized protein n=1 Tax=Periplaneta americana TaxID=6978 RepID=A0ABQ8TCX0_PERAM|nr:hypothetical protein ANN_05350 [Periplaneta americana]